MSTRYQQNPGPLSQQRYMSSPEFAELHGINGVAVSARAAILNDPEMRRLLWWLQAKSLEPGGLKLIARDLLAQYPERLGTRTMHEQGIKPGKIFKGEALRKIHRELDRDGLWRLASIERGDPNPYDEKTGERETAEELLKKCRCEAEANCGDCSLEKHICDLCINPRYTLSRNTEGDEDEIYKLRLRDSFDGIEDHELRSGRVSYFADIVGALLDYQRRQTEAARKDFVLTAIGKTIWETLDYALASRGMVVLDGLEGRGKTEAIKAWCELHLGQARFVSLKGITSKTIAFREIAKALGIASSYTRSATEMQQRIEDVLKRSRIMLVIDEAHFLFNQSRRMYSRPELVDWIDTAICNQGVPVALVTTPQFIVCMTRAADQVEWNFRQFRRRVKRWVKLPATNSEDDIKAVARNVFKKADAKAISKIVGYALLSKRDLSAVGDVASEVRAMLGTDDLTKATVDHVHRAIYGFLLPSDKAFMEGMETARSTGRKSRRLAAPVLTEGADPDAEPGPVRDPDTPALTAGRREIMPGGTGTRAANRIVDLAADSLPTLIEQ